MVAKTAAFIYSASETLDRFIERRVNSLDNIKEQTRQLRKQLEVAKTKNEDLGYYENEKVIRYLKAGEEIDLLDNLDRLKTFLSSFTSEIDKNTRGSIDALMHRITFSSVYPGKPSLELMHENFKSASMIEGKVPGYEVDNDGLTTYIISTFCLAMLFL